MSRPLSIPTTIRAIAIAEEQLDLLGDRLCILWIGAYSKYLGRGRGMGFTPNPDSAGIFTLRDAHKLAAMHFVDFRPAFEPIRQCSHCGCSLAAD